MNRLLASVAAVTALAVAPAAVALDRVTPNYSVSVSAAPSASTTQPESSAPDNSSGGSTQTPGMWGGSGQSQASDGGTSGTQVASAPGVVMIDTVVSGGEGAGTGIVLRSNGIILTNYHVVKGSTQIRVVDSNNESHTATVIGYDSEHDIAVLKLTDGANLTTAKLDTAQAIVGDKVTAIGQGGGKGVLYTTSGTITAVDQQITAGESGTASTDTETLENLVETNAQIVPGYSGGPLFDSDGEVIGVNTAASSRTPITGYAIPIADAVSIADQIQRGDESGTVRVGPRAAIGVQISSGTVQYGSDTSGATIMDVVEGGAAEKAGITAGSTITSIAGNSISSVTDLTDTLERHNPGDAVSISWTDASGEAHTATITLGTATTN